MWRLLCRLLPFPDILQRFGINLPSICPLCKNDSAELEHCMFRCPTAQQVWHHFRGLFGLGAALSSSIRVECHSWWLLATPGSATAWCANLIPCLILWTLWCSYNRGLYDGQVASTFIANRQIKQDLFALSSVQKLRRKGPEDEFLLTEGIVARFASPSHRLTIWVKWLTPPSGRLKLNTDASFADDAAAGGTCLRDSSGCLIAGLCFRLEATSALEAEAFSLRCALLWCMAFAKRPFTIEVDSLALATLVEGKQTKIPWKVRDAVLFVRSCLDTWGSTIRHVYREANQVADALASAALSFPTSMIFCNASSLPEKAKLALMYDLRGFSSLRAIRR
ncbi:PREDICTED: uncharacterized protein LOC109165453 [Ipomoea nil]|uniref:uncharacterized protein LOC109165453 n=1 Tax=Ipomoea nil TaxID=35883 RepID=UPI000901B01A|nr:PREDICTED: uncharacterized protein LOC109165453 [Ipomoea nil]